MLARVGFLWLLCLTPCRVSAAVLHWEAPVGCPDEAELARETEQVLGESLSAYALEVSAAVVATATQYTLSLRVQTKAGEPLRVRELTAASCHELMEAAAIAIALAAAESGKAAPPPPAATPAPDPDFDYGPPEPPPRPAAAPEAPLDSQIVLGASALSDFGVLPGPGLGGELQLGWRIEWLRIGIGASWLPARSMQLARNVRAQFGLLAAALLLCGQQRVSELRIEGCGVAELGEIEARLVNAPPSETRHTPWRALGIRASLSYPLAPPLEVAVSLAALAPLTRPEFFRNERESSALHQPAKLGARLWLGLVFSP